MWYILKMENYTTDTYRNIQGFFRKNPDLIDYMMHNFIVLRSWTSNANIWY